MPIMSFDLEDGLPPVSFSLKTDDAYRFMHFMEECTEYKKKAEAAPELLEALQELLGFVEHDFFDDSEFIVKARAAIAKATQQ